MSFEITDTTRRATENEIKEPLLILEIDGLPIILSSKTAFKYVKYGDEGIEYGMPDLVYGGKIPIEDQKELISFSSGSTTTSINQQLEIDKGRGSSISSVQLSLVDIKGYASKLVSPGVELTEILGKKCVLWFGFNGTSYPEDFIILFRGFVDDVNSNSGLVTINVSHPDQKKRQKVFTKGEAVLDGAIDNSVTTIAVNSTASFTQPVTGPDGSIDSTLLFYIKIGDEIIQYTSKTATQFLGCTRGALGTSAASHSAGDDVNSFYRMTGNCIDLALKFLLSGVQDYYLKDLNPSYFNRYDPITVLDNAILFSEIDLEKRYNVTIGDFVTITDSPESSNNVSLKKISAIFKSESGSVVVIDGVTFADDDSGLAKVSFRSRYDVWEKGLGFIPEEVDINQHESIKSEFLSNFEYDFYLKDELDGKEFLEKEIYLPYGCYSLPRKAQSSIGILAPPKPGNEIVVFNEKNIFNPNKIKLRRSTNKNFFNAVIYKYEELALDDKLIRSVVTTDSDSLNRIKNQGNKALVIEAHGMRRQLNAAQNASIATIRRLNQYKFAAEFIDGLQVSFGDAFNVEIGDVIIFDGSKLSVTDFNTGLRNKEPVLMQVVNKYLNIKTGETTLDIVNMGYGVDILGRYCLISPSSIIKSASSDKIFTLDSSFSNPFGTDEGRKWRQYDVLSVVVRSPDFSVIESAEVESVIFNTVTLKNNLSFTPLAGYIMELDVYNPVVNDILKVKYGWMRDGAAFDDGKLPYLMS